ncbi:MBL fold metallo-hydrolase [Aureispira anguillae]|uniref:MBL fold metallo-hydrolase n=1 Tax=Aureispira anguillae TaxID=2864201 RepID=A0A916DS77_9BACT|nr:MBL fold metallo-hydrolase [Aureispira anguillae]BDS11050.1 MBL fold metallo-hydrolase [Aureispira anguillae]
MKIEQLYTKCLAQGAYYIASNGEAAIIDPLRETQPYIDLANQNGVRIKYIFETHFHADFVSGHIDLAKKTGATIVYGPSATTDYEIHEASDHEVFQIGDITITVLHTPGHTPESTTYLLTDQEGHQKAIFTGDTLFIGDVGRPDLAIKGTVTQEDLAGMLYDSLRNKIMPLPDDIIVYPAHGAGSACGKNMSTETFDTLGNQKKVNYALRADMTKEEFIQEVTSGLNQAPQYFAKNAMLNKTGYGNIDQVIKSGLEALDPKQFETKISQNDVLVLDTRKAQVFKDGFIPHAINIGIDGGFAPWVGTVIIDINQPILIVADAGREQEVVTRLARIGYDNTIGYLAGGMDAWIAAGNPIEKIESISAEALETQLKNGTKGIVLDVRKPSEYEAEHVTGAQLFPLDYINDNVEQLNDQTLYYVHCRSGYRSMVASSILKSAGYQNIIEIKGGFLAIQQTGLSCTKFKCPNSK